MRMSGVKPDLRKETKRVIPFWLPSSITISYGHTQKTIELPEDNLAWVAGPNDAELNAAGVDDKDITVVIGNYLTVK